MAEKQWPRWYAEDGPTGWTLNESRPDGSDGWLANFADAGEEECNRAAHCHNCFDELVAACKAAMKMIDDRRRIRGGEWTKADATAYQSLSNAVRAAESR
jgi:hypothetical protein